MQWLCSRCRGRYEHAGERGHASHGLTTDFSFPTVARCAARLTRRITLSETIAFIVHLPGKTEHREELESSLLEVLEAMAKEPDFINTDLHRSVEDPDTLVLYENWACSREYFVTHHLSSPYRRAYEAALPRLLKRERTIEFLDPVRTFVKPAM